MDYGIAASFVLATLVFLVTPGPVMAMVTHNTLRSGAPAGLMTAIGAEIGKVALIGLMFAGLSVFRELRPEMLRWLSLFAALYLLWRAANMLRYRHVRARTRAAMQSSRPLFDGLTVGIGHPTALAFFSAFLPQFVNAGEPMTEPMLRLTACYLGTALLFDVAFILVVSSIRIPAGHGRFGGFAELGSVAVYLAIATAATADFIATG
ncbi:MAG TPA: LysE family transporter [Dongiaceae bacterium]